MANKKTNKTNKKTAKKIEKQVIKRAKKHPKAVFIIILILIIILALGAFYCIKINPSILDNIRPNTPSESSSSTNTNTNEGIVYDEFQIHFLEFDSASAGDSIYIKAGDTDILIDAGNKQNQTKKLVSQINEYCTDSKLEYLIMTHGDQDHIQSLSGTSKDTSIIYNYSIDNIIYNENTKKSTTNVYQNTIKGFEYAKNTYNTTITYAHSFFESDGLTPKDSDTILLSDNVSMTILWNKYYFTNSSNENNYSVSVLFTYKDNEDTHNFILTGDLEKEGEEAMVEHYDGLNYPSLPHCDLYKGGHHGSKTSSTIAFLAAITPDICCVCTCAGTNEYTPDYTSQFPTQHFINRISQYTDKVYITGMYENGEFKSMNGHITISCGKNSENKVEVGIAASNNLTKLKDTAWFNETIYVKNYQEATSDNLDEDDSTPHGQNSDKSASNVFYTKDTEGVTAVKRRVWLGA